MFGFVRRLFGAPAPAKRESGGNPGDWRRAKYDAAQTNDDNRRHWAAADGASANAANVPAVREKLRNRARFEEANNCYLRGLLRRIAKDLVGRGPRLQLRLKDRAASRKIEREFGKWCKGIGLAKKLRLMHRSMLRDGESFGVLTTNPMLDPAGVQLDLRLYEADQVATPDLFLESQRQVDGIKFDAAGNPVEYHLLKVHPGALDLSANLWAYDVLPAKSVIHWFDADRAGQARGIPHVTAALPLSAYSRRFTLATVATAEAQSSITAVMKTDQPPPEDNEDDADEDDQPGMMQRFNFDRVNMLALPYQWDAHAFESKNVQGFGDFKGELIDETGNAVGCPSNISRGSSARYNFSSGRLDRGDYESMQKVDRGRMGCEILDRLFLAWLDEAIFIPGLIPAGLPPFAAWDWEWFWDGFIVIDPVKDRNSKAIGLQSGQLNLSDVLAEEGRDWEEFLEQRQREMLKCKELGLPNPFVTGGVAIAEVYDKDPNTGPKQDPEPVDEEEETYA